MLIDLPPYVADRFDNPGGTSLKSDLEGINPALSGGFWFPHCRVCAGKSAESGTLGIRILEVGGG